MASVQIVITGPPGAGKTTFVRTLSEVAVMSADASEGPGTEMDFGRITIAPDLILLLFAAGVGGASEYLKGVLAGGLLGYVLVVEGGREESYERAAEILGDIQELRDAPYVVAVNRRAAGESSAEISLAQQRLGLPDSVPVIPIQAVDRDDTKNVLLALLYTILEGGSPRVTATA